MKVVRTEDFQHEGQNYQVRVSSDGWNFTAQAFKDSRPASGYQYSVDLPTAYDLDGASGSEAVNALVSFAKSDILEGKWCLVEEYIASLNLKDDEGVGCQNCTSRDVEIKMASGRKLYHCRHCGNIWYGPRGSRGPYEQELDDLAEGVVKNGESETFVVFLLNAAFRQQPGSPSFWDQVGNWCNQNYLEYETFEGQDDRGKPERMIRFTRKVVTGA